MIPQRLKLERLDERALPSAAGAWPDSMHLTLSFPSDRTVIAGHRNTLNAMLALQAGAAGRSEILRALQTWAAVANVNVGVVADSNLQFGSPGMNQGDTRFGDIRVGAHYMTQEALAISVPHDAYLSGTWSGDVLFNSSFNFNQLQTNLYSVALHEFGHVLGLDHSTDPTSVMSTHAAQIWTGLAASDVAAIRSLYGPRLPDLNEGSNGNNTQSRATNINMSDGALPAVGFGDLTTMQDVDYYRFDAPAGYTGPMTVRVRSAGISLLAMRATLTNASGQPLAIDSSISPEGGQIVIRLPNVSSEQRFYLKIDRSVQTVFGTGRYAVAATFDGYVKSRSAVLDRVMAGPYDELRSSDLAKLLKGGLGVSINDDAGVDDDPIAATQLDRTRGGSAVSHYGIIASLANAADVDYYQFRAVLVAGQGTVLTATVTNTVSGGAVPRLALLDANLASLPVQVLVNGNGTFTIQATGILPDEEYFLRVSADPFAVAFNGNYGLSIDLGGQPIQTQAFGAGNFSSGVGQARQTLYIAKPQLFQLMLETTASGASAGTPVTATITNAAGVTVMNLTARAGEFASGPALLLAPGEYTVRYSTALPVGAPAISFVLRGKVLSEPIGPVRNDTTLDPRYIDPTDPGRFLYPDGTYSFESYYWLVLVYGP